MKHISDKEKIFFLNLKQQILNQVPEIFFDKDLTSNWIQDYYYPDKNKLDDFEEQRIELRRNGIHLEKAAGIEKAKITIGDPSKNRTCLILTNNISVIRGYIADLCLIDQELIQIRKIEYSMEEEKFYIPFYIDQKTNFKANHYFLFAVGKSQKYIDKFFNYNDEMLLKELYLSYFKQQKRCSDELYHRLRECKKQEISSLVSLINIVNY